MPDSMVLKAENQEEEEERYEVFLYLLAIILNIILYL